MHAIIYIHVYAGWWGDIEEVLCSLGSVHCPQGIPGESAGELTIINYN